MTSHAAKLVSAQWKIQSILAEVDCLCHKLRALLLDQGLAQTCFAVELLARESLNNAVVHAHHEAADRSVVLDVHVGRKWICLQVTDEGSGFNWQRARRKKSTTTDTTGRGLMIYALYAARVRFNRRGNQITFWIMKDPEAKE